MNQVIADENGGVCGDGQENCDRNSACDVDGDEISGNRPKISNSGMDKSATKEIKVVDLTRVSTKGIQTNFRPDKFSSIEFF